MHVWTNRSGTWMNKDSKIRYSLFASSVCANWDLNSIPLLSTFYLCPRHITTTCICGEYPYMSWMWHEYAKYVSWMGLACIIETCHGWVMHGMYHRWFIDNHAWVAHIETEGQPWVDWCLRGKCCFYKRLLIFCIIAPLSLFDRYHVRLKKNGKYMTDHGWW